MKIDHSKEHDKVKQLLLILGFPWISLSLQSINSIMGCVESTKFEVSINDSALCFFMKFRGHKQGCLLSPFLFPLVVEILSRLIIETKGSGFFRDMQVKESIEVTHFSFIDSILLSGKRNLRENKLLKNCRRLVV